MFDSVGGVKGLLVFGGQKKPNRFIGQILSFDLYIGIFPRETSWLAIM